MLNLNKLNQHHSCGIHILTKHTWVQIVKSHNENIISTLTHLAVDVHNDSMVKTLSAWSWTSRSLAHIHAENQIAQYSDHTLDGDFVRFIPPAAAVVYQKPDRYSEMLSIILKKNLPISCQCDCSIGLHCITNGQICG